MIPVSKPGVTNATRDSPFRFQPAFLVGCAVTRHSPLRFQPAFVVGCAVTPGLAATRHSLFQWTPPCACAIKIRQLPCSCSTGCLSRIYTDGNPRPTPDRIQRLGKNNNSNSNSNIRSIIRGKQQHLPLEARGRQLFMRSCCIASCGPALE